MINFLLGSNLNISLGRPLTASELIERRKNSPDGVLKFWGTFRTYNGVLKNSTPKPVSIELNSDEAISSFVRKKEHPDYLKFIVFTSKKSAEFFFEQTRRIKIKDSATIDFSCYYTEVYD